MMLMKRIRNDVKESSFDSSHAESEHQQPACFVVASPSPALLLLLLLNRQSLLLTVTQRQGTSKAFKPKEVALMTLRL